MSWYTYIHKLFKSSTVLLCVYPRNSSIYFTSRAIHGHSSFVWHIQFFRVIYSFFFLLSFLLFSSLFLLVSHGFPFNCVACGFFYVSYMNIQLCVYIIKYSLSARLENMSVSLTFIFHSMHTGLLPIYAFIWATV